MVTTPGKLLNATSFYRNSRTLFFQRKHVPYSGGIRHTMIRVTTRFCGGPVPCHGWCTELDQCMGHGPGLSEHSSSTHSLRKVKSTVDLLDAPEFLSLSSKVSILLSTQEIENLSPKYPGPLEPPYCPSFIGMVTVKET